METKELYDKHYYETHYDKSGVPYDRSQKQWRDFFKNIARRTKETLSPETVFEFGCAKGFLVEAFRDIGIKAYGCGGQISVPSRHPNKRACRPDSLSDGCDLLTFMKPYHIVRKSEL